MTLSWLLKDCWKIITLATAFEFRLGTQQLPREICHSSNVHRQIIAEAKLS